MLPVQNKIIFFKRQINYWNFGVYIKQKFVTLTSHIVGFCLLANIKIEKIDEENLIEFKNIIQIFHQDYFKNYPHMQRYVSAS